MEASRDPIYAELLVLCLRDQGGYEIDFKVHSSTMLVKVMKAYCKEQGIDVRILKLSKMIQLMAVMHIGESDDEGVLDL